MASSYRAFSTAAKAIESPIKPNENTLYGLLASSSNLSWSMKISSLLVFFSAFTILQICHAQVGTNVTVGTGGDYPTLTGFSGLFDEINAGGLTGNTVVNIISDLVETAENGLSGAGMNGFTLTIQPSGGMLRNITGTNLADHASMIRLEGASNITIDGGAEKHLLFRNTKTNFKPGPCLYIAAGAGNNVVQNCIFENNHNFNTSQFHGAVLFNAPSASNYNTITNCDIQNTGSSWLSKGINWEGNGGKYNITNCNFKNCKYGVYLRAGASGCDISDNNYFWTINANTQAYGFYLFGEGFAGHTMTNNYVGGSAPQCGGSALTSTACEFSTQSFIGVFLQNAGSGTPAIVSGNIVQNINWNIPCAPNGGNLFTGIQVNGNASVANNIVGSETTSASIELANSRGYFFMCGSGSNASAPLNVSGNIVANILLKGTHTPSSLDFTSGFRLQSTNINVVGNKVFSIQVASGANFSNLGISGISADGNPANGVNIANNYISLGEGESNAIPYAGVYLYSVATNGTVTINYNSIYLGGTNTGSNSSYAMRMVSIVTWFTPYTIRLRNNIFYNNRTGGSAHQYAIGNQGPGGNAYAWDGNVSDYNLFVAPVASRMGLWGTQGRTFAQWQTSSGNDKNSWSEVSATVPAANLFSNVSTGDLSILPANTACWYSNGKGMPQSNISNDYGGDSRSTSVPNGATDIGADEFDPTVDPPNCTVSGSHTNNGTETVEFGKRTIASISWGAPGTLPTLGNIKYFTGANPPDQPPVDYMNCYWHVPASGGSGFTYDLVLNYGENLLLSISNESSINMMKKPDVGGAWATHTTSVNTVDNTMTANGFGSFSLFSGTTATPAPITLLSFTAQKHPQHPAQALLQFRTATERDNAGFDIERSSDGRKWSKIGYVAGHGTTDEAKDYTFTDDQPLLGHNYYRLKQMDYDGAFEYSPVASVFFETGAGSITVWPNPVADYLMLQPSSEEETLVSIFDQNGRLVLSTTLPEQESRVEVNGLLPGVYVAKWQDSVQQQVVRFVKQ